MRDKYTNKTPVMRFFHKYTGFIICGIAIAIIGPIWYLYDEQSFYFENWSCIDVIKISLNFSSHELLTMTEHVRYHEILKQCFDDEMFIEFEHEF